MGHTESAIGGGGERGVAGVGDARISRGPYSVRKHAERRCDGKARRFLDTIVSIRHF